MKVAELLVESKLETVARTIAKQLQMALDKRCPKNIATIEVESDYNTQCIIKVKLAKPNNVTKFDVSDTIRTYMSNTFGDDNFNPLNIQYGISTSISVYRIVIWEGGK